MSSHDRASSSARAALLPRISRPNMTLRFTVSHGNNV
jgi:hypothetical protein